MYDLLSYKERRIEQQAETIKKLTLLNEKYMTFLFELLIQDCPEDYKRVIKSELLKEEE